MTDGIRNDGLGYCPAPEYHPPTATSPNGETLVAGNSANGRADTEALARDVLDAAAREPERFDELVSEVLNNLPDNRRDDFSRSLVGALDDAQLRQLAQSPDGLGALQGAREGIERYSDWHNSQSGKDRIDRAMREGIASLAQSDPALAVRLANQAITSLPQGEWDEIAQDVIDAASPAALVQLASTDHGRGELLQLAAHLSQGRVHGDERATQAKAYAAVATAADQMREVDPGVGLLRTQQAESAAARVVEGLPPPPQGADDEALRVWTADVHARYTEPNRDVLVTNQLTRYLELRGDTPRELSGSALTNEIGIAMGFMPNRQPVDAGEQAQLDRGEFAFFQGDELVAIQQVRDQIVGIGGENARVTTLPIVYDSPETGLPVTLPLFRVEDGNGNLRFVDHVGRRYDNFGDWRDNNTLPPGTMSFPSDGHLAAGGNGKPRFETANTPETPDTFWENYGRPVARGLAIGLGVAGGIVLIVGTGGLAAVGMGAAAAATTMTVAGGAVAASTAYGMYEGGAVLHDRATHGQSLSLDDPQARAAWLGFGASALTFATLGTGALARATTPFAATMNQGSTAANLARYTGVAAQYADTAAMANLGWDLARNWDQMSGGERLMAAAQFGFWGTATGIAARQAGGVRNLYGVDDMRFAVNRFQATHPTTDAGILSARRAQAETFLASQGRDPTQIAADISGMDFRYPVEVVTLQPGDRVFQWMHSDNGRPGNWWSLQKVSPDGTGIASHSTLNPETGWNNGQNPDRSLQPKVLREFVVTEAIQVLQTRAIPTYDSWSIAETGGQPVPVHTQGGELQLFFRDSNGVVQPADP